MHISMPWLTDPEPRHTASCDDRTPAQALKQSSTGMQACKAKAAELHCMVGMSPSSNGCVSYIISRALPGSMRGTQRMGTHCLKKWGSLVHGFCDCMACCSA
jgi:hypothetical protein